MLYGTGVSQQELLAAMWHVPRPSLTAVLCFARVQEEAEVGGGKLLIKQRPREGHTLVIVAGVVQGARGRFGDIGG